MAARNRIISGGALGCFVMLSHNANGARGIALSDGAGKSVFVEKTMVSYWNLVNTFTDKGSAVKRGALGLVLFGGIGLLGAATAKKVYQIRFFWVANLEPSLMEVDESIYNRIIQEYY
ncbi:MAG: hypothetical protein PUG65_03045 [Firmicutes bacterium]|nr:hypothetical protein [Bacillota bacterium]